MSSGNGFNSVRQSYHEYEDWLRDRQVPFTGWELARLRKEMGVTLARMSEILGLTPSTIAHLERNPEPLHKRSHPERMHRLRRLVKMAIADHANRMRAPDFND